MDPEIDKDLDSLLQSISNVCVAIARRKGFDLPKVGGYVMKSDGKWQFVEGQGSYIRKDGVMQWKLYDRQTYD
jgi:hypothetical protein